VITEERLKWLNQIFCGWCEEAYQKLGLSHIQDGCYGGHIENTNSAITSQQMA
jgi:hypothetical protein